MTQKLHDARYLSLATFRRNGDAVRTPVWFAASEGVLYAFSAGDAGKVKRLRNFSRVEVAPCDVRGGVRGEWQNAEAYLVDDAAECRRAYRALRRKYGVQMLTLDFFSRLGGKIDKRQLIRIEAETL